MVTGSTSRFGLSRIALLSLRDWHLSYKSDAIQHVIVSLANNLAEVEPYSR